VIGLAGLTIFHNLSRVKVNNANLCYRLSSCTGKSVISVNCTESENAPFHSQSHRPYERPLRQPELEASLSTLLVVEIRPRDMKEREVILDHLFYC
jgi:hypothetical protein